MKKLNVLLALTDQLRYVYKNMVKDYTVFFNKSQGAFKGEKRTYTAKEGTIDDPSKRGIMLVQTTVTEKFNYFIENSKEFIDALFSQEKTNAMGLATANLIVEGKDWGTFTSLELLRLKSLLESDDLGKIEGMLMTIPVRSDAEVWKESKDDDYTEREVFETELFTGVAKTTQKTPIVLKDPNLNPDKLPANYQSAVVSQDTILELGDYTKQNFSGEWSQRQKALTLQRRTILLTAITKALKEANECDVSKSDLTADRIFGYLFFDVNE